LNKKLMKLVGDTDRNESSKEFKVRIRKMKLEQEVFKIGANRKRREQDEKITD